MFSNRTKQDIFDAIGFIIFCGPWLVLVVVLMVQSFIVLFLE